MMRDFSTPQGLIKVIEQLYDELGAGTADKEASEQQVRLICCAAKSHKNTIDAARLLRFEPGQKKKALGALAGGAEGMLNASDADDGLEAEVRAEVLLRRSAGGAAPGNG